MNYRCMSYICKTPIPHMKYMCITHMTISYGDDRVALVLSSNIYILRVPKSR